MDTAVEKSKVLGSLENNQDGKTTKKRKLTAKATEKSSKTKTSNDVKGKKKNAPKRAKRATKLTETVKQRREAIIKVLIKHKIFTEVEGQNRIENPKNIVDQKIRKRPKINNHIGDLGVPIRDCFNDYVNFKCDNAEELDQILQKPLKGGDYGYDDCVKFEDDEIDEKGDKLTMQTTPIGLFLSKKSNQAYWSFCREVIMFDMHDVHYMTCGFCREWNYWHCNACNKCSYGQSMPKCEHCNTKQKGGFIDFMRGFPSDDNDDSDD